MSQGMSRTSGWRLSAGSTGFFGAVVFSAAIFGSVWAQTAAPPEIGSLEELGRALFADPNLSRTRSQSCISCHSPELAFTDPRELGAVAGAVSLGADGRLLGDRNAPSVAYASLTPEFHVTAEGEAIGGFFWEGRAINLEEQAGGPPVNPAEMGMPDKESVVARIKENRAYVSAFTSLLGEAVFNDAGRAYTAITKAIAAFERTPQFNLFDSKYDRSLRGEAKLSEQETLGRDLFFSNSRSSCSGCHVSGEEGASGKEVFSNFRYYNIGVPANRTVRALNGAKPDYIDAGLSANPAMSGSPHDGKFKVPSLRNVAITGPYMHNGVFKDLRTVLLFHQRFSQNAANTVLNPETGQPWENPETPENLAFEQLKKAPAIDDRDIDALVAFLKTLTDRRYEQLLER